jgi:hypothetical protein
MNRQPNFLARKFSGGHSERETPVPIPNTEVKPLSVDGTARVTVWESRTLPGVKIKTPPFGGVLILVGGS